MESKPTSDPNREPAIRSASRNRPNSSRIPKGYQPLLCRGSSSNVDATNVKPPTLPCKLPSRSSYHRRCIYRDSTDSIIDSLNERHPVDTFNKLISGSDFASGQDDGDFLRLKDFIRLEQHRFNEERSRFQETEKHMYAVCAELRHVRNLHAKETDELNARNAKTLAKLDEYEQNENQTKKLESELENFRAELQQLKETPSNDSKIHQSNTPLDQNRPSEVLSLKEELQSVRNNFQDSFAKQISQLAACEHRIAAQAKEIADLNQQIDGSTKELSKNQSQMNMMTKVLRIRSDLIASMQQKDEITTHQLRVAHRWSVEKSNDFQKILRHKDKELAEQRVLVQTLKDQLDDVNSLHVAVEERTSKLIDENERLRCQFSKIMDCGKF